MMQMKYGYEVLRKARLLYVAGVQFRLAVGKIFFWIEFNCDKLRLGNFFIQALKVNTFIS